MKLQVTWCLAVHEQIPAGSVRHCMSIVWDRSPVASSRGAVTCAVKW